MWATDVDAAALAGLDECRTRRLDVLDPADIAAAVAAIGAVDIPSLHDRPAATGDHDAAWAAFVARQPMGRIEQAGEIAALALDLASDDTAFTTGQAHVVDGGWST